MKKNSSQNTVLVGYRDTFIVDHARNARAWLNSEKSPGVVFWSLVEIELLKSVHADVFPRILRLQVPGASSEEIVLGVTPLPAENGWRWRCALRSVSEEVAQTEALVRERERFRGLVELSSEGFSIFDAQARIIFESETNYLVHGYRADEMMGRSLFEFTHPDDQVRLLPRFQALAGNPGQRDSDIVRFRHKEGHWIYLDGTVINQLHDPRIKGMINNFRDITERLQMEADLREAKQIAEEATRQQRHFLANLSHELWTPLSLIKQPIADLAKAAPEQDLLWDIAQRNIVRLESLLNELIDLLQLEAGQVSLSMQAHDLHACAEAWVAELRGAAEAKGIRFLIRGETRAILFFDRHQLSKAGLNLLRNAIKFSPEGGVLELVIRANEVLDESASPMVELRVNDSGRGLSPEQQAQAFDRFYQADGSDARENEGMGIGLAIAREVVHAHGGEIGVDSQMGAGASFWFRIPRGVAHVSAEEVDLSSNPVETFAQPVSGASAMDLEDDSDGILPTLLLVEDNRDMRHFLRMHLEPHYRVVEQVDGLSALRWLDGHRADLVLADVMMPRMDGVTLCRKIRLHYDLQTLPVLLLSAKRTSFDRRAGLEAGASDYLGKPFDLKELLLRLQVLEPARPARTEAETKAKDWVKKARDVMQANLATEAFAIGDMAKALNTSERQLHRLCHRHFRMSPSACLRHYRLEQAREMLEQGRYPNVKLTAQAVGMSPHYFSRLFKNHFGEGSRELLMSRKGN